MPLPETVVNEIAWQAAKVASTAAPQLKHSAWLQRLRQQIVGLTLAAAEPHLKPARVVVRSIEHLQTLPHGTVLMTSARSVVQVQCDEDHPHQLLYMGTEETDPLDPIALWWNKMSRHTLTMILPAVIIHP